MISTSTMMATLELEAKKSRIARCLSMPRKGRRCFFSSKLPKDGRLVEAGAFIRRGRRQKYRRMSVVSSAGQGKRSNALYFARDFGTKPTFVTIASPTEL